MLIGASAQLAQLSERNGEERFIRDPGAAACISANLAEETFKAFCLGERSEKLWREFFALEDLEIPQQGVSFPRWLHLWRVAQRFGEAHTRLRVVVGLGHTHPIPHEQTRDLAHFDDQADAGTLLTVNRYGDEGRDADEIDSAGRHIAP